MENLHTKKRDEEKKEKKVKRKTREIRPRNVKKLGFKGINEGNKDDQEAVDQELRKEDRV